MRTQSIYRLMALLVIAAMAIAVPQAAEAAGTASGTAIGNNATIDYQVSGVPQTQITTGPTATFLVDTKVNATVTTTDGSRVITAPSSTARVLTFTVTNNGNAVQDYLFTTVTATDPFLGLDNFDATNVQVFVETNGTPGYQAGADTATFIDELVSDATTTVYIVADIPASRITGDIAAYGLLAQTANGGGAGQGAVTTQTGGADNPLVVDVVFADAAGTVTGDGFRDGRASSRSAYEVLAAALTITKGSAVYSDPFNVTSNPKAIPGAVITYTLTVANAAASATATSVTITDSLAAEIGAGRLSFNPQFNDGVAPSPCGLTQGIVVDADGPGPGLGVCNTNAGGDDNADFTANTVTVSGLSIAAGTSATIKFQVIITP